ncbi:MAG: hypothetical protein LUC22_04040, partial [Prevotella sp.]|nr:hypothetical protein [Prevotella sp.]
GHYGLRERLGKEGFSKFCNRVYRGMSQEAKEEYLAYHWNNNVTENTLKRAGLDPKLKNKDWDELNVGERREVLGKLTREMMEGAADEYTAHLAEKVYKNKEQLTKEEQTLWDKIVSWVKDLLGANLNDKDIARYILETRDFLKDRAGEEAKGKETEAEFSAGKKDDGLFHYFEDGLTELIKHAKRKGGGLIKKVVSPVSSRLKEDLRKLNVDIDDGYKHVIDNFAINHMYSNHGDEVERLRGQIPITDEDILRIPDIVNNYDRPIEIGTGKTGLQNIIYQKTYPDGTTLYVEEQRRGRKELAAVSMRKKKKPFLTDANRTKTTPIPDLEELPGAKIGKAAETAREDEKNFSVGKKRERTGDDSVSRRAGERAVEALRRAGIEVIADADEMQRVLDEEVRRGGNSDRQNLFAGEKGMAAARAAGLRWKKDDLDTAKRMDAVGADEKKIKLATGWEKGADGKWRHEIGDFGLLDKKALKKIRSGESVKLKDLTGSADPHIVPYIEAYPDMGNIAVRKENLKDNTAAYYSHDKDEIVFNGRILGLQEDLLGRILVHEMQHAVQRREGFATGGNTAEFLPPESDSLYNDYMLNENRIRETKDKMYDIVADYVEKRRTKNTYPYFTDEEFNRYKEEAGELPEYRKLNDQLKELEKKKKELSIDITIITDEAESKYKRLAGEVEARNVEKRFHTGYMYRNSTPASETEDWPRKFQIVRGVQKLTTSDGELYGFVKDGKVYLDPKYLNADTPVHEYTHLWDTALMKGNAELWKRGKELLKQTKLWDEVRNDAAYSDIADDEDKLASEVHSRLSGAKGRETFEKMVSGEDKGLIQRVREWLDSATKWIKEKVFGLTDELSVEEFASMPIKDLLGSRAAEDDNPAGHQFSVGKKKGSTEEAAEIVKRKRAIDAIVPTDLGEKTKLLKSADSKPVVLNKDTARKIYSAIGTIKNNSDGREVMFFNNAFKKSYVMDNDSFLKTVPALEDAFKNSVLAYTDTEDKYKGAVRGNGTPHKPHPNIKAYHNYVGKIKMGGETYYVRYTVTEDKGNENGLHSTFVSNVKLYKKTTTPSRPIVLLQIQGKDFDKVVDTKLQDFFDKARKIEENAENGTENAENGTENAENGTVNFSVGRKKSDEPIEVVKTKSGKSLVGIHNITAAKLRKVLRLGGLANPSAAVVDLNKGSHTDYGEISLLMPASMVDARTGRNAGTFLGDAYTATYPRVEYLIGKGGYERLGEDIKKLPEAMRSYTGDFFNEGEWSNESDNRQLSYMFLHERGEAPGLVNVSGEADAYATNRAVEKYIKEHNLTAAFEEWCDGLKERYNAKGGIWNGDVNSSGGRKYIPETLTNVSRQMNKRRGAGVVGGASDIRSYIAKVFGKERTLDKIKSASGNIISDEEERREKATAVQNRVMDTLNDILTRFSLKPKDGTERVWIEVYGEEREALLDASLERNPQEYLRTAYGAELSDADAARLKEMVKDIRDNYPAQYFETKFERPVMLNEFAAAVVPEGTDGKLVSGLEDAGLKVSTYNGEENRRQAIEDAADADVRFSVGKKKDFEERQERVKNGGGGRDTESGVKLHRDELGDVVL